MALRDIAKVGNPVLRERLRQVSPDDIETDAFQRFVDDLIATMREANGAGLAAPQVHEPIRVCVLEVTDNPRYPYKPRIPLTVLVNPVLTPVSEATFSNFEGCLSVPDLRGRVERHAEIRVQALDRHGKPIDHVARGITAGTYQHEVDHLDGKLFLDRVSDTTTLCTWKEFRRHHEATFRAQVEAIVAQYGS